MGRRKKHPICGFDITHALTQDIIKGVKCRVCDRLGVISKEQLLRLVNPDNFVEWQKKCVCDFENNNNTHSKSCLTRFESLSKVN